MDHEFAELQGSDMIIENEGEFRGLSILALQSIRFRLDKSGATVFSQGAVTTSGVSRSFIVDRPFLVVMKRRSAKEPYFVAWIETPELLELAEDAVGS